MTPMPTARAASATAAFGVRIFVAGGETPMLFAVNDVYNVVSNSWTCQAPMTTARHGIAAVTLDDRILTPAGGTVQGLRPTNHVDSFIPQPLPSDSDHDGDVDLADYLELHRCLTGPGGGVLVDCEAFDFEPDVDVDMDDFLVFQLAFTSSP